MSRAAPLLLLGVLLALTGPACPPAPEVHRVVLGDFELAYWQTGAERVSRIASEYTFAARLENRGAVRDEILAWVATDAPGTRVLDGALRFGPVDPGATAPALDTFRIRHDRREPFDPASLRWLELDRFGGWKAIATDATGRFRTEEIDGVWWLVTPLGHAWYCAGVTGFDPHGDHSPPLGTSPYRDNVLARYGSEAAWAEVAQDRFRAFQLNCVGGWSDTTLFADRIPYAVNGHFMRRAPAVPGWPAGLTGKTIHDVFDPGFPAAAAAYAQGFAGCASNPYCFGVYTDNEIGLGPGIFQVDTWVDAYMTLPAGAPGKLALQDFLAERYEDDVAAFNTAWGTTLASFDDLQDRTALGTGIFSESPAQQADRLAFLAHAAERYFRVAHDALRAVSPDLLVLGARFSPPFTHPSVIAASGPWVDVVSLNDYEFHPAILVAISNLGMFGNLFLDGPFHDLDAVHALTGKPIMITEYFYRLRRPDVTNLPPGLPERNTEAERVAAYRSFQDEMLARPFVVGTHWFEWMDQPREGRGDGENQRIGLVDIEDDVYPELTEALTEVNGATYPRRAALASP